MDVQEIIRRMRAGESNRAIHQAMDVHRGTVKKYREWAESEGYLSGVMPDLATLQQRLNGSQVESPPPQNVSSVEPYREMVEKLRQNKVEIKAIHQRLRERGYEGSYQAVWRFVRQLEPTTPEATVRVERAPGEEAQVDFGYAGKMVDTNEQLRKVWAFVMTLSYSRHQYVEFVFDQKVGTWLECHRHAFEFFGGVPERVVIDNLKAAITRACWDDPQVQQSYRECAEHYGFLIAPCRPRTPEHKGKVEQGGVHYVARNFLGGREPTRIDQANREAWEWCLETAGQRTHGTTQEQPLRRFEEIERTQLKSLPPVPYDRGEWKMLKLHRDCHVVFEKAYYSAPFTHIGQQVRVRGGNRQVRIYSQDYQLLATHDRLDRPGERSTHPDHLPPEKLPGWLLDRVACREEATAIGPSTAQVVDRLLDDPVVDRLPTVGRLLRLRKAFGDDRLEAACRRAVYFDDPAYQTVKRILREQLDDEPLPTAPAPPMEVPARTFMRSVVDLVGSALGGVSWS